MKSSQHFFIGSLPHQDPRDAIEFVKRYSPQLPFLPQLPESNPQEDMIGQVLRGLDLGFWDEKAASCLELFQNEFVDCPQFKIQIAGPYTVARSMSTRFMELAPLWIQFWKGLRKQISEAAFQGELWLQLDEPFWSANSPLPDGYTAFLQEVKATGSNMKLGIHSCATERPDLFPDHVKILDFFAFDFAGQTISPRESKVWSHLMEQEGKILAYGGLIANESLEKGNLPSSSRLWVSAPCGFYGWDIKELETQMGKWSSQ
jgi:methionine synthase II (cobalamin-independent)